MATDILIVDDEADIRKLIAGILQDEGYQTREAANSSEAYSAISARQPNLIASASDAKYNPNHEYCSTQRA